MTAKTCGNCKHLGCLPPPRRIHVPARVLEVYGGPGKCLYPEPPVPMVQRNTGYRMSAWTSRDATKCPCWEFAGKVVPR